MNIQIFGKSKCFDTRKAERYFKERKIKYQLIDLVKYGMSKGEFQSVKSAIGGIDAMVDENSAEYERQGIKYLANNDLEERLMDSPSMFKTPIVRNGKKQRLDISRKYGERGNSEAIYSYRRLGRQRKIHRYQAIDRTLCRKQFAMPYDGGAHKKPNWQACARYFKR